MGLNDACPFTRADVPILTFLVVGAVLDSGTELRNCENLGNLELAIGTRPKWTSDLPPPTLGECGHGGLVGFLILSQPGERSDRRGTFSRSAGLSHTTGSGPNQADRRGDLILFTPTQEIALAPEPLLTFTCPKTKDRTPTRVETDAQTLRASWKSRLLVKCPSCGGMHEISVRDAYLNGAVDVVGRSDRQRVRRKSKPG